MGCALGNSLVPMLVFSCTFLLSSKYRHRKDLDKKLLDRTVMDRTGLEKTVMGRTVLDGTVLDGTELEKTLPNRTVLSYPIHPESHGTWHSRQEPGRMELETTARAERQNYL